VPVGNIRLKTEMFFTSSAVRLKTEAERKVFMSGIAPSWMRPKPLFWSGRSAALLTLPKRGPIFSYMFRMCGILRSLCGDPSASPLNSAARAFAGSPGSIPPSLPPLAPNGSAWQPTQKMPPSVAGPVVPRKRCWPMSGLPGFESPGTDTTAFGTWSSTVRNGLGGKA
jgi:hypothetical protein